MDLLVIDRDAVSEVDLIWHFMTEPGWRLLLSVGSCHPCLQGQSLLEAISETRVKKVTQSEKNSHFDFELLEPRGFVHFATKEGALRVLEESLVLGW